MANGHGGARPGAGRKRKDTREQQLANRGIVLASVSRDDLQGMVEAMVERARRGDHKAFSVIAPYLMGSPTHEIEISGAGGGPLEVRVVYDDPDATPADPAAAEAP